MRVAFFIDIPEDMDFTDAVTEIDDSLPIWAENVDWEDISDEAEDGI